MGNVVNMPKRANPTTIRSLDNIAGVNDSPEIRFANQVASYFADEKLVAAIKTLDINFLKNMINDYTARLQNDPEYSQKGIKKGSDDHAKRVAMYIEHDMKKNDYAALDDKKYMVFEEAA